MLYYLSVAIFVFGILGGIMRLAGFSIFKFLRYLREELMIVLGTASSDSVLPQIMRKLEHMGIKVSTAGLVIPTGTPSTSTPLDLHDPGDDTRLHATNRRSPSSRS